MVGFSFVAKGTGNRDAGTGNRDAISLPRSLGSKLPSILIASRFPLSSRFPLYAINRGNNRADVLGPDGERDMFLGDLARTKETLGAIHIF